jgi:hypothetical protein
MVVLFLILTLYLYGIESVITPCGVSTQQCLMMDWSATMPAIAPDVTLSLV